MAVTVNVSVATGCFDVNALMRGPAPHEDLAGVAETGEDCARDGKASSDDGSRCACGCEALGRDFAGVSFREGKGSGAPSSSCLF